MSYIKDSKEKIGYKIRIFKKPEFWVTGYTRILSAVSGENAIPAFYTELEKDGRLDLLKKAAKPEPAIFGMGSWDPECEKGGQRYTVCIEETKKANVDKITSGYESFNKKIAASLWMCFEIPDENNLSKFWKDDPYKMLQEIGYKFNTSNGFDSGLHFDVYPPEKDRKSETYMEFWITVNKP